MIASFRNAATRELFETGKSRRIPVGIQRVAQRKLKYLAAVDDLNSLRAPAGNHLEALKGDRRGQFSIRVNDQYRICFVWIGKDAHQVEIVDYH
ncbi:MAG: type II toxin-antitoxin system RelE/ParE family toxin [Terriglobales bacterium]|jgi:proteic killer suppression protein